MNERADQEIRAPRLVSLDEFGPEVRPLPSTLGDGARHRPGKVPCDFAARRSGIPRRPHSRVDGALVLVQGSMSDATYADAETTRGQISRD